MQAKRNSCEITSESRFAFSIIGKQKFSVKKTSTILTAITESTKTTLTALLIYQKKSITLDKLLQLIYNFPDPAVAQQSKVRDNCDYFEQTQFDSLYFFPKQSSRVFLFDFYKLNVFSFLKRLLCVD